MNKFVYSILVYTSLLGISTPGFSATPSAPTATIETKKLLQVPGVYRFMVDDIQVTALSDGSLDLDLFKLINNISQEEINRILQRDFLKNPVRTSVNVYLIEVDDRHILVDTGIGQLGTFNQGRLQQSLNAAGVSADQITDILITHAHMDHIGGLVLDGNKAFPNATVHLSKADFNYYFNELNANSIHADAESMMIARNMLQPYVDSGKLNTFSDTQEIVPGITATLHPGHTPGSAFYTLGKGSEKLVFVGDLIHSQIQFTKPQASLIFDMNEDQSRKLRENVFTKFSHDRTLVAAPHLPFPGIGHLRQENNNYDWVPVNYEDRSTTIFPVSN